MQVAMQAPLTGPEVKSLRKYLQTRVGSRIWKVEHEVEDLTEEVKRLSSHSRAQMCIIIFLSIMIFILSIIMIILSINVGFIALGFPWNDDAESVIDLGFRTMGFHWNESGQESA